MALKTLFSLCAFLLFFCPTTLLAQCALYEVPLDERIWQSQLIVEGRVADSKSFWDDHHQHIYTVHDIEIFKVFKGATSNKNIKIVTPGGTVENEMETVSSLLTLKKGATGVFMCVPTNLIISETINDELFEVFASSQGFIRYNLSSATANDIFHTYKVSRNDLYKKLSDPTALKYKVIKYADFENPMEALVNKNASTFKITGFSPASVTAGTGERLTISGSGFGNVRGIGSVGFENADGNDSLIMPFDVQYLNWTDNKITVEVPSSAGTGRIHVTTNNGASDSTSSVLKILYARSNLEKEGKVYKPQLVDDEGSGGYVMQMNEDFILNSQARQSFINAILTWRCATLVNWAIGENTTVSDHVRDNINVVSMDKKHNLPKGVLGICYSYYTSCNDGKWFVSEYDVIFKDTSAWHFGNGPISKSAYDFETVALHELGHGHQLQHVIDTTDLMHYSLKRATMKRTLKKGNLDCANLVSTTSTLTGACGYFPLRLLTSSMCSNPEVAYFKFDGVDAYPNPFFYETHVSYLLDADADVTVDLFNLMGQQISRLIDEHQLIGKHVINIDLKSLGAGNGIFIVRVRINDNDYSVKLVSF